MDADEASGQPSVGRSEVAGLRATCRRQARVIDTLTTAVSSLRASVTALKAENAELRAEAQGEWVETRVALDPLAPRAARRAVADVLADRVAASLLERAKLVTSELVTNSVRHSGVPAGSDVVIRIRPGPGSIRLEVEDPGRDGLVVPRPVDPVAGAGFGLNLVQALSERWGIERAAARGTRVWAELSE